VDSVRKGEAQVGGKSRQLASENGLDESTSSDSEQVSQKAVDPTSQIYAAEIEPEDQLLECLIFLTEYYSRPKSREVLRAGLPLDGPYFTPSNFVDAAQRSGFRSRVVKRSINSISKDVLPAVLALKEGEACVLLEFVDKDTLRLMLPETGGGSVDAKISTIEAIYSGYAIFIRPEILANQDTSTRRKSGQSWFWGTIAKNWWAYFQVGIAALVINIFGLASPLFIMNVYDRVIPNAAIDTLFVLAFGMATVVGTELILKSLRAYFIDSAGKKTDVIVASRIFDQVLDMRMESRPGSAGAFANTLQQFETLRDFFTSATLATLVDLPFVIIFIFVLWLVAGPLALVLAVAVPIILLYGFILQFPLSSVVRKHFEESERKAGVLVETIYGLEVIKSVGGEGRMRALWQQLVGVTALSSQKSRFISMSAVNFASFVQQMTTIAVVIYGVNLVTNGDMSVGGLIAAVMLGGRALGPLGQVAQLLTRFHQSRASLQALNGIMAAPVERPAEISFVNRPDIFGDIEFKDVSFTYPEAVDQALKGISFSIKAGDRVGIIGRVGSGKSTVSKLLLKLYEPESGTILVDGTDIRQIDPVDLRRNMGYVLQDPFLFRGTVHNNITVGGPIVDDSAVLEAAKLSGINEFIDKTSLGYDLPVGERGDGLSGGQRQAVTIARALLRSPNILVMDEPTSSMDIRSEELLKRNLNDYLKDKTLILVTHRASLLSLVDRVIILDGGTVVADGPRDEIVAALAAGKVGTAENH
jgi:ATP-binding cassette subfamily C protein LapB